MRILTLANISGFSRPFGIVDGRAHQEPACAGVERGRDVGDIGRERPVRIGEHGEVERLADLTCGASVSRT